MTYKHCIMCPLHQKTGLWPLRCWDAQRDCCMPSAPGAFADILGPIRWLLPCAHVLLPHSAPLQQQGRLRQRPEVLAVQGLGLAACI